MLAEGPRRDFQRAVAEYVDVGIGVPPLARDEHRELCELKDAREQVPRHLHTLLPTPLQHVHNLRLDAEVLDRAPPPGLVTPPLAAAEGHARVQFKPAVTEFVVTQSPIRRFWLLFGEDLLPGFLRANHR